MEISCNARAAEAEMLDGDDTNHSRSGSPHKLESSNTDAENGPPAVAPCQHSITDAPSHIGASSSASSFPAPAVLDLRPTTPPRGSYQDWGGGSPSQAGERMGKGKGKEIGPSSTKFVCGWSGSIADTDLAHDSVGLNGQCRLLSLPPELIDSILSFLSPIDLSFLSATCRLLYPHATADPLWQAIIQDHVPGAKVTSPYPFESYMQLYKAHDPHWFLTKHKIWFSDGDLAGRLILTRYDQRRGCIEGYQLVAVSSRKNFQPWLADSQVMIHAFEPKVRLHLDKPIVHLPAASRLLDRPSEEVASVGGITFIRLRGDSPAAADTCASGQVEASGSSHGVPAVDGEHAAGNLLPGNRFQAEIPMEIGTNDNAYCHFMLARPLDHAEVVQRSALPFPYGNIWPPPVIPARHRAVGSGVVNNTVDLMTLVNEKPKTRQEVSDQIFRIRKGLQMRIPGGSALRGTTELPLPGAAGWAELTRAGGPAAAFLGMILPSQLGLNIGEAISTYSTLDPALYTPTPEKPYRGIWVGDYSGHGCEFLLINQPDDPLESRFDRKSIDQREGESDEEFAQRRHNETVFRGRLEAIKLTGDPNVPRGEYTFVADDIGETVAVVQHEPFTGTRVVKSKGHIAHTGFLDGKF